jgi:hypothetical protein
MASDMKRLVQIANDAVNSIVSESGGSDPDALRAMLGEVQSNIDQQLAKLDAADEAAKEKADATKGKPKGKEKTHAE